LGFFSYNEYNQYTNTMNKIEKLIKLFKNSGEDESEQIELDNLDEACLTYDENDPNNVVVENEHGTQFPISDLSEAEIDIFIYLFEN